MPIRVEFTLEAAQDLRGYARSGNMPLFLKKLLRLEDVGADAGQPLRGSLAGWRKIVVGDRDWRILFRMSETGDAAIVTVVGDRGDEACYELAERRLASGDGPQATVSLAAVMFDLTLGDRKRRGR